MNSVVAGRGNERRVQVDAIESANSSRLGLVAISTVESLSVNFRDLCSVVRRRVPYERNVWLLVSVDSLGVSAESPLFDVSL